MTEDHFMSIEDRNYARDARVTATYIEKPADGTPFHWEVCDLCRGNGTVVNPSIDASGLTAEDFADDPDFAEDYKNGTFDIQCPQCRGRTTIPVKDKHWTDDVHGYVRDGRECRCGSGETRQSFEDARGIFVLYACDQCKRDKLAGYRPEIFADSNYDTFGDRVEPYD